MLIVVYENVGYLLKEITMRRATFSSLVDSEENINLVLNQLMEMILED